MGIYARRVLPWVIDTAMRNPEAARLRAEWVPRAAGVVLELGMGSGLNLPHYSPAVRRVVGVDPSRELQAMARERAAGLAIPVEHLEQGGEERLPLAPGSIDTAVMTWTLCSLPDPGAALREMRRVLRPEGRLLFIEHGAAPEADVRRWQDRLTPLWRRLAGGCHLNRRVPALLSAGGWEVEELTEGYLAGPRPVMYTYRGVARPGRTAD